VSWYQKVKNYLDFTEARDSEWQWHLGQMQICASSQADNHVSTPPLSFLQALPAVQKQHQSIEGIVLNTHTHATILQLSGHSFTQHG